MDQYSLIVKEHLILSMCKIISLIQTEKVSDPCIYITFDRSSQGVSFPSYLSNDREVTVVLQHQFWDLKVNEQGFSVILDFFGEKHQIYITFNSVSYFFFSKGKFCTFF